MSHTGAAPTAVNTEPSPVAPTHRRRRSWPRVTAFTAAGLAAIGAIVVWSSGAE